MIWPVRVHRRPEGPRMSAVPRPTRRQLLHTLAALGVGPAVFQRALAAQAEKAATVTPEMVQQAEWIAGITLSEEDRKAAARSLTQVLRDFDTMRGVKLDNSVPPALCFFPAVGPAPGEATRGNVQFHDLAAPKRPDSSEELAFLPVRSLAALLRTRQVSSVELTKLCLERLHKYDPALRCVVTFTEDLALKQ